MRFKTNNNLQNTIKFSFINAINVQKFEDLQGN
jgi:hypothetical protein